VARLSPGETVEPPAAELGGVAPRGSVTEPADLDRLVSMTLERFGRIDGVVVNTGNLGGGAGTGFAGTPAKLWDRIFAVNTRSHFLGCKFVMPAMRERGSGSIVNIASVVAVAGQPGYLHYVATKGAVLSMTKGLAKECGSAGVRVNVIAPGFVITDATRDRPIEWQQSFLKARALSREQRPEDLVGTAMYLLSDLSSFVSGQTIVVDGGHIMY